MFSLEEYVLQRVRSSNAAAISDAAGSPPVLCVPPGLGRAGTPGGATSVPVIEIHRTQDEPTPSRDFGKSNSTAMLGRSVASDVEELESEGSGFRPAAPITTTASAAILSHLSFLHRTATAASLQYQGIEP